MVLNASIREAVIKRAKNRCEYCQMHQSLQGGTFHVEHVVPRSRGGLSELDNLAWAYISCNLHKSDRSELLSPDGNSSIRFFSPRIDAWSEHFAWDDYEVVAKSEIGQATITSLHLNDARRIKVRQAEQMFDLFPPG